MLTEVVVVGAPVVSPGERVANALRDAAATKDGGSVLADSAAQRVVSLLQGTLAGHPLKGSEVSEMAKRLLDALSEKPANHEA
jgi:hypothetical protein